MPKTRQQKKQIIEDLIENFKKSKSAVLSDYTGLTVSATEELREKCKAEGVELFAVKKTLLKKAFEQAGHENLENIDFDGSLAIVFGYEDEIAPARIIDKFAKNHENIKFRGGLLEGKVIGLEQVISLAKMPSKPELYAKLVGSLNSPISGFVNVLAGNMRGLVNVLSAIKDTKKA